MTKLNKRLLAAVIYHAKGVNLEQGVNCKANETKGIARQYTAVDRIEALELSKSEIKRQRKLSTEVYNFFNNHGNQC